MNTRWLNAHSERGSLLLAVSWLAIACADGVRAGPATITNGGFGGSSGGVDAIQSGGAGSAGALVLNVSPDGGATSSCRNLQCRQQVCATGTTSVTGTVFAPNGTLPLYNVRVFIPNAPLPKATLGLTCDRCGGIPPGEPVVSALSDYTGAFRLENAPIGRNIPLVMQVGKWRRQIMIPEVSACTETKLTERNQTRLPRNRNEGDMPRIAVVTAFADNIACLIPKLGIDRSEWGARGEDKAATFFYAASELPPEASPPPRLLAVPDITPALDLWGSEAELSTYDLALLSCEGYEAVKNKGPAAFAAMTQYLAKGGRIFGSHEEHLWYQRSPDHGLQSAVKFHGDSVPMSIDTSFPKGKALADWLHALAPMTAYGAFKVPGMFDPAAQVDPNRVRSWVTAQDPQLSGVFTINMPVGAPAENQCGKGVHFETHVTDSQVSNSKASFAESCAGELTPGETLLSFLFFDLASCIQDEAKAPKPPEVSPK